MLYYTVDVVYIVSLVVTASVCISVDAVGLAVDFPTKLLELCRCNYLVESRKVVGEVVKVVATRF